MNKILYILICVASLSFSCNGKIKKSITLKGSGLPSGIKKVYIASAYHWDLFLDSADCNNGDFILNYVPQGEFSPFFASLCYRDSDGKIQVFALRNEIWMAKDGKNHSNTGFMLDYGTSIFDKYEYKFDRGFLSVKAGRENDLFHKYESEDLGYISNANQSAHKAGMEKLKRVIKENFSSYYILNQIYNNKDRYSKADLQQLLGLFEKSVLNSAMGKALSTYQRNKLNPGEQPNELTLLTDRLISKKEINKTAKLNMLIFWASWCGPCRKEIPELILLRKAIKSKDLYMAGISIDETDSLWRKALLEDKPTWEQFFTTKEQASTLFAQYSFSSIPFVIFTDQQGKEVARFDGYNSNRVSEYKSLINSVLNIR